jgi:hypothetical protein
MKTSPRFWLAATAVVLASLLPKMVLSVLRQGSAAAATAAPSERLRTFLVTTTGAPVQPVSAKGAAQTGSGEIAGWRFRSGGCAGQAFLSGLPGNLDFQAHAWAPKGARISYVYRGLVSPRPPMARLAFDVMASRSIAEFLPASAVEPRYVVVVVPGDCAPPALPWVRLRLN